MDRRDFMKTSAAAAVGVAAAGLAAPSTVWSSSSLGAVTPIKVRIGLRPNGHADHPAWEQMPMVRALLPAHPSRDDVDMVVRQFTLQSWFYDKCCGHDKDGPSSPRGTQWGMRLVTPRFAVEAIATFPGQIVPMSSVEAEEFYDVHVVGHLTEFRRDHEVLQELHAHRALLATQGHDTTLLDHDISRALDPDDPHLGVRRQPMARWSTAKKVLGIA